MKHTLILAVLLLTACSSATPQQEPNPEGNVGAACTQDSECETPMSYLIQSNCPYTSMCIEGSCAVVCPIVTGQQTSEGTLEYESCSADTDCDCGNRPGRCACVNNACVSITEG